MVSNAIKMLKGGRKRLYLGDLRVEVLHVLTQHLTKLAQDLLVPGVVLQVHLGLDLRDRETHGSKCVFICNTIVHRTG